MYKLGGCVSADLRLNEGFVACFRCKVCVWLGFVYALGLGVCMGDE